MKEFILSINKPLFSPAVEPKRTTALMMPLLITSNTCSRQARPPFTVQAVDGFRGFQFLSIERCHELKCLTVPFSTLGLTKIG
jgi:hypothetical protein